MWSQELIEKTRERQSSSLTEISWAGRSVPVKNEQVRVLLLNVEHNAAQLADTTSDEHRLSLYETMMKGLVEAQQILRDEYKDDPVSHFDIHIVIFMIFIHIYIWRARCWAQEHSRISPPRFLAECRMRRLNQASFVLLYFVLFCFFWVVFGFYMCLFLICVLSCSFQRVPTWMALYSLIVPLTHLPLSEKVSSVWECRQSSYYWFHQWKKPISITVYVCCHSFACIS